MKLIASVVAIPFVALALAGSSVASTPKLYPIFNKCVALTQGGGACVATTDKAHKNLKNAYVVLVKTLKAVPKSDADLQVVQVLPLDATK